MAEDQQFQSLYRRFRPQTFAEVLGQDHVTRALCNAVREHKVAHAYLFSGPRGTGKTSTARILAKALNCLEQSEDGEPCNHCASCEGIRLGASLDVNELDAASNSGVDAMRDLIGRVAISSPGRWKVYIVDEVHMLSTSASNALLKTLEEPPSHVVFVLATTDPQKVLPTIRSRTQHYEFKLLSRETLSGLLSMISKAAGIDVGEAALDGVVRKGSGSARDALSALDQVAAGGEALDADDTVNLIIEALCERDAANALAAVAEGLVKGRDARRIGTELIEHLRHALLAALLSPERAPALLPLAPEEIARVASQARRMGNAAIVRAMEVIGGALVEMRDALDTRVCLEVAIVRVASPAADTSPAALLERIDRLERILAAGGVVTPATAPTQAPTAQAPTAPAAPLPPTAGSQAASPPSPAGPPPPRPGPPPPPPTRGPNRHAGDPAVREPGPADDARAALGEASRRSGTRADANRGIASPPPAATRLAPDAASPPTPPTPESPPPSNRGAPAGSEHARTVPTRDDLTRAWGDQILAALSSRVRARFGAGRFVAADSTPETGGVHATFSLPNLPHRDRCEEVRPEVESVLAAHFGVPVALRLVVEEDSPGPGERNGGSATGAPQPDEEIDVHELVDAPAELSSTAEDWMRDAFPGAEEVTP